MPFTKSMAISLVTSVGLAALVFSGFFSLNQDSSASNMTSGNLTDWCMAEEGEIENLEVEWARNHFGEENYTGQQLDRITDLKIENYNEKCYPSTYQSRTINELLDKIGED